MHHYNSKLHNTVTHPLELYQYELPIFQSYMLVYKQTEVFPDFLGQTEMTINQAERVDLQRFYTVGVLVYKTVSKQ